MILRQFYDGLTSERRRAIAEGAQISPEYLYQICSGARNASPATAKRLRVATDGALSLTDIRPDIWADEGA